MRDDNTRLCYLTADPEVELKVTACVASRDVIQNNAAHGECKINFYYHFLSLIYYGWELYMLHFYYFDIFIKAL